MRCMAQIGEHVECHGLISLVSSCYPEVAYLRTVGGDM
jgi:hypothetical protein